MDDLKLYMVLAGCKPPGRFTEQHDVFFGIAPCLKDLVPHINSFWPEAKKSLHIDAWRTVTNVNGFKISVCKKEKINKTRLAGQNLFFLNLGGYKKEAFEEFHYKMLCVAPDQSAAIQAAKKEVFYKETGFKGAASHVDDTYGIDVDDVYNITDLLNPVFSSNHALEIMDGADLADEIHLGYLPLWKIKDQY